GSHTNIRDGAPVGRRHNLLGVTAARGPSRLDGQMGRKKRIQKPGDSEPLPPDFYRSITKEIEAFINEGPRGTQTRLAAAARMDNSAFRHRMDEYRNERFSFEEIELIRIEAGKPPGWPYAPSPDIDAFDAFRKVLRASLK
ncbi:MAG TPA: hypothetical protein VLV48_01500, partial [Thermoanaerobaculia bacterium]|nr:hypothetical protein [Thermoanaerobaculia bacterium]